MEEIKHWELDKLENLINEKLPSRKRQRLASQILATIVHILGKHLKRTHGYSVLLTVLKREMRELGRKNAILLKELFGVKEATEESIKSILNIAAMILGLELGLINEREVAAIKCPFYETLREFNDPFLCNACLAYNNGIVEELTGGKLGVKRVKWLFNGDGCCIYGTAEKA
jgi:predicted hydrocarbon binding protein